MRCQRARLRASAAGAGRPWVRAAITGTMAAAPNSVAWRTMRSISAPRGSAWINASRQPGGGPPPGAAAGPPMASRRERSATSVTVAR